MKHEILVLHVHFYTFTTFHLFMSLMHLVHVHIQVYQVYYLSPYYIGVPPKYYTYSCTVCDYICSCPVCNKTKVNTDESWWKTEKSVLILTKIIYQNTVVCKLKIENKSHKQCVIFLPPSTDLSLLLQSQVFIQLWCSSMESWGIPSYIMTQHWKTATR